MADRGNSEAVHKAILISNWRRAAGRKKVPPKTRRSFSAGHEWGTGTNTGGLQWTKDGVFWKRRG